MPRLIHQVFENPLPITCDNSIYFKRKTFTSDFDVFTFLNESYRLKKVGWDNQSISKLWRYNLHYFEFLLQLDQSNDSQILKLNLIEDWIECNRFGKGTAWEPYPTSLRITNWIKWHWSTGLLTDKAILSLWNQVRWLADRPEYHLLGNHLFVNAKALLFACVFFGLDEHSVIYRKAIKILNEELSEQFLNDGAHFELSPMYHALAMEDLLDLYQLGKTLPLSFPSHAIQEKFLNGMNWLYYMSYSNGDLAHFNDCANDIALSLSELQELGQKVNLNWVLNSDVRFNYFKDSGFVVYKNEKVHLIADLGDIGPDYLPGHSHADTLSFELAIKGNRVIVNTGTGEYGFSEERLRQRSTSSHSTVELDHKSSSEVWSGFRVAQRSRITKVEIAEEAMKWEFGAVHDGYTRIQSKPLHKRNWILKENSLEIIDEVSGSGNLVQLRYFLHPNIQTELHDDGILLSKASVLLVKIKSEDNMDVINSTYHDKFGSTKINKCLLISGTTPFKCRVSISWN